MSDWAWAGRLPASDTGVKLSEWEHGGHSRNAPPLPKLPPVPLGGVLGKVKKQNGVTMVKLTKLLKSEWLECEVWILSDCN